MKRILLGLILFTMSCAGWDASCSSCAAQSFGSDWLVVQVNALNGTPYRCWTLQGASVSNESQSDGIWWKDTRSDNLVHISGHYNRVQVVHGNWDDAYKQVGLTKTSCDALKDRLYGEVVPGPINLK